jgi:multiple sugar transport system ATP-binding protein
LQGRVELREALGPELLVHFTISAQPAATRELRELAEDVGDDRALEQLGARTTATLVGRFGTRSSVREGDAVDVAVEAALSTSSIP